MERVLFLEVAWLKKEYPFPAEGFIILQKYLFFAEERYLKYVNEWCGIAEGSKVPFDKIATLNVMEAVTVDALHLRRCRRQLFVK